MKWKELKLKGILSQCLFKQMAALSPRVQTKTDSIAI